MIANQPKTSVRRLPGLLGTPYLHMPRRSEPLVIIFFIHYAIGTTACQSINQIKVRMYDYIKAEGVFQNIVFTFILF